MKLASELGLDIGFYAYNLYHPNWLTNPKTITWYKWDYTKCKYIYVIFKIKKHQMTVILKENGGWNRQANSSESGVFGVRRSWSVKISKFSINTFLRTAAICSFSTFPNESCLKLWNLFVCLFIFTRLYVAARKLQVSTIEVENSFKNFRD